ncbi:MAG: radical SAM family heme chaperone HemW [Prevotella sp.]|nr:radical SAM family heme chaperone HemW [Prevotella sp.]MBR0275885.1 radical SAM family heme chaperone HemW [Prevotella sp.]
MAGIYIHIPFCRSRCIYCGFYSTTALDLRQRYVDALCREMEIRGTRKEEGGKRNDEEIETIYLGGGTPSQLTPSQLRQLFIYINKVYPLTSEREITIEVNPDDVTVEFAALLQQLPVNRVSMGIQTFDDQRLRFLHRRHTSRQAIEAVSILRAAGINNLSIDLMYGFPGETLSDWQSDIDSALALNVEHISAYCLMIEEGTPLHRMLKQHNGDCPLCEQRSELQGDCPQCVDEETERQMYYTLIDRLTAAGYEHYEISNFARPGFRSRHNSSYWNGTPYIGLGAAAHSYDIRSRSWNIADINAYIKGIERGERLFKEELLDSDTRYNDAVTVGLRTCEGIDLNALPKKYRDYCMKNARRYLDDGLLELSVVGNLTSPTLHLTRRGLFVSDMVMSDLMMV